MRRPAVAATSAGRYDRRLRDVSQSTNPLAPRRYSRAVHQSSMFRGPRHERVRRSTPPARSHSAERAQAWRASPSEPLAGDGATARDGLRRWTDRRRVLPVHRDVGCERDRGPDLRDLIRRRRLSSPHRPSISPVNASAWSSSDSGACSGQSPQSGLIQPRAERTLGADGVAAGGGASGRAASGPRAEAHWPRRNHAPQSGDVPTLTERAFKELVAAMVRNMLLDAVASAPADSEPVWLKRALASGVPSGGFDAAMRLATSATASGGLGTAGSSGAAQRPPVPSAAGCRMSPDTLHAAASVQAACNGADAGQAAAPTRLCEPAEAASASIGRAGSAGAAHAVEGGDAGCKGQECADAAAGAPPAALLSYAMPPSAELPARDGGPNGQPFRGDHSQAAQGSALPATAADTIAAAVDVRRDAPTAQEHPAAVGGTAAGGPLPGGRVLMGDTMMASEAELENAESFVAGFEGCEALAMHSTPVPAGVGGNAPSQRARLGGSVRVAGDAAPRGASRSTREADLPPAAASHVVRAAGAQHNSSVRPAQVCAPSRRC